jgi:alpha-glucosidase (family GH31 glycosyl hydrolase)
MCNLLTVHVSGCLVFLSAGDIYPTLQNMASSLGLSKHMSMVGMDYFGSDVGGFERKFLEQNEDEKYTQWYANSAWFDVPLRPHAWQPDGSSIETAPCRVGDLASNLFNTRQRYELVPFYYSLAHRAHRWAEPVFPPLFYYYQADQHTRLIGHTKMIGRDILVAIVAQEGQRQRDVYLPADTWVNYHTNEYLISGGQTFANQPAFINRPDYCPGGDGSDSGRGNDSNGNENGKASGNACLFTLPAYVRAGALLPKMHVDADTKNTLGERWVDDDHAADLIVHAFTQQWHGAAAASNFTLFEDDGATVDYLAASSAVNGKGDADSDGAKGVRTTELVQKTQQLNLTVTIGAAAGFYENAPAARRVLVKAVFGMSFL